MPGAATCRVPPARGRLATGPCFRSTTDPSCRRTAHVGRLEPKIALDTHLTFQGLPVELSWRAPGADHVRITGVAGDLPWHGVVAIPLEASHDLEVVAVNDAGRRQMRTGLVRVLPMPEISAVHVAAPLPLRLSADVDVSLRLGEPVLEQLERVLARQDALRPGYRPPAAVPASREAVLTAVRAVGRAGTAASGWWASRGDVLPDPSVISPASPRRGPRSAWGCCSSLREHSWALPGRSWAGSGRPSSASAYGWPGRSPPRPDGAARPSAERSLDGPGQTCSSR